MARIIEFCGSPGVGKSTIYNSLIKKWSSDCNWVPADVLYPRQPISYEGLRKFLTTAFRRINKKTDMAAMEDAADRFICAYPEYMDACWKNIVLEKESFNGTDQRFDKASYLHYMVQKIQILRECNSSKFALVDEGLVNGIGRAMYKSMNTNEEKDEIETIVQKMPLPNGVIYIENDLEENVKRLMQRRQVVKSFNNLTKDELIKVTEFLRRRRKFAIELLKDMGIPVFYLDSMNSIETNCFKAHSFIKDLQPEFHGSLTNGGVVKPNKIEKDSFHKYIRYS